MAFLMSVSRFLSLPVKGLIPNLPLLNHHALPTLPPSRLILQWQPLICPSLPFHTHFINLSILGPVCANANSRYLGFSLRFVVRTVTLLLCQPSSRNSNVTLPFRYTLNLVSVEPYKITVHSILLFLYVHLKLYLKYIHFFTYKFCSFVFLFSVFVRVIFDSQQIHMSKNILVRSSRISVCEIFRIIPNKICAEILGTL